ncbi:MULTISPECIES: tetraacyldisaccharide 4'-kinase [unclassified Alteromonas]|uniref:tetraacyldisaccharide 4'-kinase n=1 Tax=unclassified Alteromonas TaxID=2614992 RepID=UPI0005097B22|nr:MULTISPECIES: tetraacyldisaccharide 4'-kinase [unclassified Alteromonas]
MSNLVKKWYGGHPLVWLLAPLTLLFYCVSAGRRLLFKLGVKKAIKVNAPVIVVGNISVGGNGKTPVVLALAEYYTRRGIKVGILSRGYGGNSSFYPRSVNENDNAEEVGDEPRLLASRSGCTVVIDPVRARGARYLVDELGCQLIICDDGLQHYALYRDVELVVMDDREVGSGFLLPMGPLREGKWRLATVDAIIHNSDVIPQFRHDVSKQFSMSLQPEKLTNIQDKKQQASVASFREKPVSALAGIGSPQRFFNQLKAMGLNLVASLPFPDHYHFTRDDIPNGTVIMTEKDAVKVAPYAHDDCWFLPVSARISDAFFNEVNNKLASTGLVIESEKEKEDGV